jgi:hypothetical protein
MFNKLPSPSGHLGWIDDAWIVKEIPILLLIVPSRLDLSMRRSMTLHKVWRIGNGLQPNRCLSALVLKEVPHEMVQRASYCNTSTPMSGGAAAAWNVHKSNRDVQWLLHL